MLASLALAVAPLPEAQGAVAGKQRAYYTTADRQVFRRLAHQLVTDGPTGQTVAAAGLALRGTPYVAGTLEIPGPERLVCDLRGVDCVTFVETSLALARVVRSGQTDFDAFLRELAGIRYRNGEPEGYSSRLHYFSEWIRHNASRGLLTDVTATLGGVAEARPFSYMTEHRKLYPRLIEEDSFETMLATERRLSESPLTLVPRARVAQAAQQLHEGDIVAFVPTTAGLDVSHTGLVHREGATVYLLHAPDVGEQVRVSEETLADYVASHPKIHGLIVARPL